MLNAWRWFGSVMMGCCPLLMGAVCLNVWADDPAVSNKVAAKKSAAASPEAHPLQLLDAPIRPAELQAADGSDQFTFLVTQTAEATTLNQPTVAEQVPDPAAEQQAPEVAEQKLQAVKASALVAWGYPAEIHADVILLTAGGSLLAGSPVAFGGDLVQLAGAKVTFVSALFDEVTLPQKAVRAVVFQPPADARGRDQLLAKLAKTAGAEDLVVLTNGDEISGSIHAMAEGKLKLLRRGAAGNSELELTLATPGGTGQVAALAFNQPLRNERERPQQELLVGFEDGSLLVAEKLWRNDREAQVLLAEQGGVKLTCDRPAKLVSLQPLQAGITYLSDLTAHSYRHVPYLSLTRAYQVDRSVIGDRLRSGGQLYNKGLGIPSAARLTYQFDKPYRRLEAELALDDAAGMRGSVLCKVYVYAGGAWKAILETPVIRGGDKPLPISVDLSGAKAVTLIVDYADRGDELDLANWLNARLVE